MEDVQSRRDQCKDYERTAEVDASQDNLSDPDTELHFLEERKVR